MKISIIIPVFNERNSIKTCIDQVYNKKVEGLDLEIIVSDNNSNDGTKEILKELENNFFGIKFLYQDHNFGKGSNIKNALKHATGEYCLIQDADLEYSPDDYVDFIKTASSKKIEVIFGTRFSRAKEFHVYSYIHLIANRIITFIINIIFNKSFSDVLTGYKFIKTDILKSLNLQSNGFDFDTEVTVKLCKLKNIRIYEIPISIHSRNYKEGKKIHWWHLIVLVISIIKWRILS